MKIWRSRKAITQFLPRNTRVEKVPRQRFCQAYLH
jgi:hypothetical protein